MSGTRRSFSIVLLYLSVAVIAAFSGLGIARQYAPELYDGFKSGVKKIPLVEMLRTSLPSMPPLLSGESGLPAIVPEPSREEERPHLIDEEEMRGVWIATVYSIDFPKIKADPSKQKQEIIDLLNMTKSAGLNTVFFQVRPHGDAFYPSSLFPWSEYLTGEAGKDPGYDPLAFLLDEADKRGIRVHAWVNPYRLTMGSAASPQNTHAFLPAGSPVKNRPDLTMACGDGKLYLNPGEPEAMQLVVDGVLEIVEKYNVDGIHFDDYFYPSDVSYNDKDSYERYGRPMGLSLEDWRRHNTTTLMRMVRDAIKKSRPGMEFGISPSGIWQNRQSSPLGSDTNGFESRNRIFADSRLWVTEEIVDYIVPQIYWAIGTKGSDYDVLARWWRSITLGTHVKLYIGHAAYRVGAEGAWRSPTEIGSQITLNRMLGGIDGSVFYGYSKIAENALGLRDQLKEFFIDMELALPFKIAYPSSGTTFNANHSFIIGSADPRFPVYLDGKQVDRTVSGYFSVYVPLVAGENVFTFSYQDEAFSYILHSKFSPGSASNQGGPVAPPKPPAVVWLPQPQVYVTKADLTVVRAEQNADATRLQPLKKGVRGYVLAESNGYYLMDSGNWTYKPNVAIQAGEKLPASRVGGAVLQPSSQGVEIIFQVPYFTSYYVDMNESAVTLTLHQTTGSPMQRAGADPLFGDISFTQAGDHAVYRLSLLKTNRLYGYHIKYDETKKTLSFLFNNPLLLPEEQANSTGGAANARTGAGVAGAGAAGVGAGAGTGAGVGTGAAGAEGAGVAGAGAGAGAGASAGAGADGGQSSQPLRGKVIFLDPGHGGNDRGATGPAGDRGKLEKDINLDLGLELERVLMEAGAQVYMSRRTDTFLDLEPRADLIRQIKPDLAISLHRNSMHAANDISTYFGALALYTHPQSACLAGYLQSAIVNGTTHRDGGVRWQSLAMARIEECPAVLLELGFISNPADYERMNRKSVIQKEAQAILRGLISYMADS